MLGLKNLSIAIFIASFQAVHVKHMGEIIIWVHCQIASRLSLFPIGSLPGLGHEIKLQFFAEQWIILCLNKKLNGIWNF